MRALILILLAASLAAVARGQSTAGETTQLTNRADRQTIEGTVSLLDPKRHRVVLQERGSAKVLQFDATPSSVGMGERVAIGVPLDALETAADQGTPVIEAGEPRITPLGEGDLGSPRRIRVDRSWPDERNFLWVEVDGVVTFVAVEDGELVLELAETDSRATDARMIVRVFDWGGRSTGHLLNRRVRVKGVCEQTINAQGEPTAGLLWVQDARQIELRDMENRDWRDLQLIPIFDLTPENVHLSGGRKVLVRATVTKQDTDSDEFLVRGEDTFHGYASSDGTNWSSVGTSVPVAMDDSALVGLAVSSAANGGVATFDHVEWAADLPSDAAGAAASANEAEREPALQFLEAARNTPLGKPPHKGSVDIREGVATIRPGGGNDWAAADEGQFVYRTLEGEGEIVARLESFQSGGSSDKAGVMIRASRDADAASVALVMTDETSVESQYRPMRGAVSRRAGRVAGQTPQWLKLARHQHTAIARVMEGETLPLRKPIDLVGTLGWENGQPVLRDAYERRLRKRPEPEEIVTTPTGAQEVSIADLPSETADSEPFAGQEFCIRGVVTFKDRAFDRNLLFVQDESGGALVRAPQSIESQHVEPGRLIEAEGHVELSPGAPPFVLSSATPLGRGQMPRPQPFPDRLAATKAEGCWVEASGVVRSVENGMMLMMEKEGLVPAWVGGLVSPDALEQYVDAIVTVRGVFTTQLPRAPVLLVPSQQFIQVKEAAPDDAFAIPPHPIAKVREREASPQGSHRVKVTGVVTYRDGQFLCIQDASGGARALAQTAGDLVVGDSVEVVGFPDHSGESLTLVEALVRSSFPLPAPEPAEMSLDDMLAGRLDAALVRLEGVVLDQNSRGGAQLLELQSGQRAFTAMLTANAGDLPSFRAGSRVRVIGVNQLQFASRAAGQFQPRPATMDVLLRSPADVVLLQRPPRWNWRHTVGVVAALGCILVGSLVWIRTLGRRVDERTRELKDTMSRLQKETEVSATLAERDRLAAEIHDTLEQGLSGIMMQLDGVDSQLKSDPEGARRFLEMARRMVSFSRGEVRHSLWNLESSLLQNGDLGAALTEIGRQMGAGNAVKVEVEISGAAHPLPPAVEHHLLRCTQEALNNALKHAGATVIQIELRYGEDSVQLDVTDNGRGFEPESVLTEAGKSLGLRNLRSRSRKIKARLDILSRPGRGTTIQLTMPLPASADKTMKNT